MSKRRRNCPKSDSDECNIRKEIQDIKKRMRIVENRYSQMLDLLEMTDEQRKHFVKMIDMMIGATEAKNELERKLKELKANDIKKLGEIIK